MIKEYENYKISKFKWISKVPSHWIEGKVKYLFNIGRGRVISKQELEVDGTYPVYSSQTKNDGCLGYIQTFDFNGDLLTWTTDGANAGEVFRRSGKFNCTNVCGTLEPVKEEIALDYYLYLLKFLTPFYKRPDTNGAKIMNGEMAEIFTFYPPYQEQTKIAEYLDHQTGLIDAIIEKKQQLIEKLKEQRQAIINEAVTKGVTSSGVERPPMKDSGVEWLGEIPEHWNPIKIKYLLKDDPYALKTGPFGSQLKSSETVQKGPYAVYTQRNVLDDRFENFKDYITEAKNRTLKGFEVEASDILVTTRGTIGKAAIVPENAPKGVLHPCLIKMRLNEDKILSNWALVYLNESSYFLENVMLESDSTTIEVIYGGTLREIVIPLPDTTEEQNSILIYIQKKRKIFEKLISKLEVQISEIKEYRQSIISEAVTGKIDVREWEPKTAEIV